MLWFEFLENLHEAPLWKFGRSTTTGGIIGQSDALVSHI